MMLFRGIRRLWFDWGLAWTILVALPVTLPLWRPGYLDSHDGTLHLYRLMAIDRAIHQGNPFPRWLPEMSFDYGYPLLNYYPPLSYYISETFHLMGAGYIVGIKLAFGLAFILSALSMYLLAREFFGRWPAVTAAVIYTYVPYHLADTYMRGAIGESWAFVFLPLLFWSLYRLRQNHSLLMGLVVGMGLAGLILAHNLTAFVFVPFLILYVAFGAARSRDPRDLLLPAGASLIGLALSAIYWLPAMFEVNAVHVGEEGLNITNLDELLTSIPDWLSGYFPYRYFPDQVLLSEHPLSVIQLMLILLAAAAFFRWRPWRTEAFGQIAFFLFFAFATCFLQLSFSRFLWDGFRPLQYLQFPWRFLALTAVPTAFGVAAVVSPGVKWTKTFPLAPAEVGAPASGNPEIDSTDTVTAVETLDCNVSTGVREAGMPPNHTTGLWWRLALGLVAIVTLLLTAWPNLPLNTLDIPEHNVTPSAMYEHDVKNGQMGASWAGEYVPIAVLEGRDRIPHPPIDPRPVALPLADEVELGVGEQSPWDKHYRTNSPVETRLRFHGFYFPGWKAYVDGQETNTFPDTRLGLLAFDIPKGEHDLVLRFEDTVPRSLGNLLSGVGLCLVIGGLAVTRRVWLTALAIAGVAFFAFLLVNQGRGEAGSQTPRAINARFDQTATLLGFSSEKPLYKAGETAEITLYWLSRGDPQQNFHVFVHITPQADESRKVGQHDGPPVGGYSPTSRWFGGEIIEDRHRVKIGPDTTAGNYRLLVGLYDPVTARNLPATDAKGLPLGSRADLGDLVIGR